jgi:hypothetical protein
MILLYLYGAVQSSSTYTHERFLKDLQGNFLQKVSLHRVWAEAQ